ncbi:hypothetical protein G7Y89_g10847 [Cudoniella acicularis]|uniref:Ankyrin repeat protein n=1 Tax=Cudoniella acicularis TaxID=354080 RepID=A0A8H4RFL7_9HELO|nr:hypothetical protein G7Y89_g10847 [Cudoniella acicularis]
MTKLKAYEEISKKFLTYLAYNDFSTGPCVSAAEFEQRLLDYPFLEYASNNWFIHNKHLEIQRSVAHLFNHIWVKFDSPKYLSWFQAFCDKTLTMKREWNTYKITNPSIIYYPSLWGLQALLDHGANVNAEGGYYGSSLQVAYRNGFMAHQRHEKILLTLLDAGADMYIVREKYRSVLEAAKANEHNKVVEIL